MPQQERFFLAYENHIQLHPDVPVIATADVAEKINSPLVIGGHEKRETVIEISNENFDILLNEKHASYIEAGAATAGIITLGIHLLPFFRAYQLDKINL